MSDDEYSYDKPHIVIDNGSEYIRAGISGEEGPITVFPSCVGYQKYGNNTEFFIGKDAENKKGILKLNYLNAVI